MKLLSVLVIVSICSYPNVSGQVFRRDRRVIDSANPDIIEFRLTITTPIEEPGANLTETTSPLLSVGNYSTNGTITSAGDVVTVNFNTSLTINAVILSYNVTLRDGGEDFSGLINLTSTITYYTTSFKNETNSSTATICIGKREKLVVSYTEENWYIAITVLLGFVLGALLAFAAAYFILQRSKTSGDTTVTGARRDKIAEGKNTRTIKDDIQTKVGNVNQLNQECLTKERDRNQAKKSALLRKHELENKTLQNQILTFETEIQKELESLLRNRQLLESQHEENISILREMASERSRGHTTQVSCEVLEERLKLIASETDSDYTVKRTDTYALYMDRIANVADIDYTRTLELTEWRRQEVAKITNYESLVRASWNRFAKVVVNSIKTICRELLLEAKMRKDLIAFVKSEMLKMREHFDHDMAKMRMEFVKTCKTEKHKYAASNRNYKPRKYPDFESAAKWVDQNLSKTEQEISDAMVNQSKYDAFVLNLWISKFQTVLLGTSNMMKTMKDKVIVMLAQEGASKTAIAEFIESESKDNTVDRPSEVKPCQFSEDAAPIEDKSKADNVAFLSYKRIFKRFADSQPFPVDKSKVDIDIKPMVTLTKPRAINSSLQRLRELIEHHASDIERKNSLSKPKRRKGVLNKLTMEDIRTQLESSLAIWRQENNVVAANGRQHLDSYQYSKDLLLYEENLSSIISSEMSAQWKTKSQLDLLRLDLNALERLMMSLLQLLVSEHKISPAECNTVIKQHRIQIGNLRSASTTRARRRLEQVTRKRLHSPRPKPLVKENDAHSVETSQITHHLNAHKAVANDGINRILENSEAAKERFDVLRQLNEQQALELREMKLKVIQALVKAARVPSGEMNACFTLLLHHRKQEEIEQMMRVVFMGENDFGKTKTGLLAKIRELVAQQKHRIAENVLRTDDDFMPTPLNTTNRLQRIKQPHHVTFDDGSHTGMRDRLSPLPSIRPEPVGRTATPDQDSFTEFEREDSRLNIYNNPDSTMKSSRRRKKRSLKSLSVAK